jgi:pimeloyl-ACP methyl ester carboxylesterase
MSPLLQRGSRPLLLACLAAIQSGCVSSMLADRTIKAPNQQMQSRVVRDADFARRRDQVYTRTWRLRVGPPDAELAIALIEPAAYRFKYDIEKKQDKQGHQWFEQKFDWQSTFPIAASSSVPKGTLLILHGYLESKEDMQHWALAMAANGYRCVLVDLRGHGRSTGDTIGFGAFEVSDLTRVLDDLQGKGLVSGKIGIIGMSYGASMGLLLAGRDARVGAVVAFEPFSNAETAVVEFAHGVAPKQAAGISDATFKAGVVAAARRGHFSWRDGDVLAAMQHMSAPVLFYHGAKDTWISPENSRRLYAQAPAGSKLVIMPDDDHIVLSMRLGPIFEDVQAWFDRYLAVTPAEGSAGP